MSEPQQDVGVEGTAVFSTGWQGFWRLFGYSFLLLLLMSLVIGSSVTTNLLIVGLTCTIFPLPFSIVFALLAISVIRLRVEMGATDMVVTYNEQVKVVDRYNLTELKAVHRDSFGDWMMDFGDRLFRAPATLSSKESGAIEYYFNSRFRGMIGTGPEGVEIFKLGNGFWIWFVFVNIVFVLFLSLSTSAMSFFRETSGSIERPISELLFGYASELFMLGRWKVAATFFLWGCFVGGALLKYMWGNLYVAVDNCGIVLHFPRPHRARKKLLFTDIVKIKNVFGCVVLIQQSGKKEWLFPGFIDSDGTSIYEHLKRKLPA